MYETTVYRKFHRKQLPIEKLVAIYLGIINNIPYQEIADRCGCHVATVKRYGQKKHHLSLKTIAQQYQSFSFRSAPNKHGKNGRKSKKGTKHRLTRQQAYIAHLRQDTAKVSSLPELIKRIIANHRGKKAFEIVKLVEDESGYTLSRSDVLASM